MSEPAKVRVVRCPKCDNLLPELADYSVYLCGGCGAALRAKNKNVEADTFSEEDIEERVAGVSKKISEKSENLSDASENDVKSIGASTSRADKEVLRDCDWVVENDLQMNKNIDEFGHAKMAKEFDDLKPQFRNANGSQGSGHILDWRTGERGEMEWFRSTQRIDVDNVRFSNSKYSEEGPSNYQLGSNYSYAEPAKSRDDSDMLNKVEYLEQDRAELLRRLEELKEQLSRSCDVVDKPKDTVPLDRRVVHQDPYRGSENSENWTRDGSLGLSKASMQYAMPDKFVARPHMSHRSNQSPFMSGQEMAMHSYYPSLHSSNQVQGFADPYRSQMLRRAPHQAPGPLQQQPSHPCFPGQYMDNDMANMDLFEPYPHNTNLHQPSCSCFHCYNKYQLVPPPVPPTVFRDKRFSDVPNNQMFFHHENPDAFGTRDYNTRFSNLPPLNSLNPQSHTRWPSDLSSEGGGFVRHHPPRVVLATGGRRCLPVAGGAPFVTCCNCFELLQLPITVFSMEKNQKKMRCATCSKVIVFAVANKKLVLSVYDEAKRTPLKVDDSYSVAVNESSSQIHGQANWASMDFSSDDYDNSGYDFQSMDRKPVSSSTGQGLSSNKSVGMRSLHSTSSCASEDEDGAGSSIATRNEANSPELPMDASPPQPQSGSPLQDHFDYSNKYNVNRFGKGSRSGRAEHEKVMPKNTTSRQNSIKDAGLATEIDISSNEFSNTGTSQDSGDARVNKGAGSFFAGIFRKNSRDLSRSDAEQGRIKVTVNGHSIPDRLVKKAEKLAGPIQPGQYWYDPHGGFWGAMGGPGLGIIPPFIEEFNYPMPENCAGGNTGVFVNRRELHQKDLNLLGKRGLPTERDRSYIIEISGRVLDEKSGEELDCLGKLAPTVERAKRGFGMKVSREAA